MVNNFQFDLYSVCNPSAQRNASAVCSKMYASLRIEKRNREEIPDSVLLKRAEKYVNAKYSREKRYLIIFARDFAEHLNSAKWLQSDEGRKNQKSFDFLIQFEDLKEKMKEFRWSKEFLKENGIDFNSLKKLYFALA